MANRSWAAAVVNEETAVTCRNHMAACDTANSHPRVSTVWSRPLMLPKVARYTTRCIAKEEPVPHGYEFWAVQELKTHVHHDMSFVLWRLCWWWCW